MKEKISPVVVIRFERYQSRPSCDSEASLRRCSRNTTL